MELEKRPADEEEWHLLKELESLGIEAKRISEFNDKQELQNLVENIKQTLYQEYKTHYSQH
jgi:soluble P-type ATPase